MLKDYRDMMAEARIEIDLDKQIRFGWEIAQAADDSLKAASLMFETTGAGVVYSNNELQRFYRDILTMPQHGTQIRAARGLAYAQNELGIPITGIPI